MSIESRERPAGLWAIGIIAILLGCLGICGGAGGIMGSVMQEALVELQEGLQEHQPQELQDINHEIQTRVLEITRAWRIPTLLGYGFNLLTSLALMVGAILLFRWHPNAATIFIGAVALSIVADLFLGGLGLIIQQQTMGVMEEFTQRLGAASGGNAASEHIAGGVMRATGTVQLCFTLGWFATKLGFYVGSIVYLRREAVRTLFR